MNPPIHLESETHGGRSTLRHAGVMGVRGADLDPASTDLGWEGVSRLARGTDSDRSAPTRNQCAFGNTLGQESHALSLVNPVPP